MTKEQLVVAICRILPTLSAEKLRSVYVFILHIAK